MAEWRDWIYVSGVQNTLNKNMWDENINEANKKNLYLRVEEMKNVKFLKNKEVFI